MHVIRGRNINTIYPQAVSYIQSVGRVGESRAGTVLVAPGPVCAVYERPDEMVLLDPTRRANPFLHLMECLWHLGARSDAAFLNHYVRDFGARFANEDGHLDGAYGVRWRRHFSDYKETEGDTLLLDQLDDVVEKLKKNPDDRRIVIQMWDPSVDNNPGTKDACCNQQLFLRVNEGRLDMTVTCRSNDAVWGAMGANCVHFPFLQLYLAGRLGLPAGKFYQVSNNYHAYEEVFAKIGLPRPGALDPYTRGEVESYPIGTDFDTWDEDLQQFLLWHDELWGQSEVIPYHPKFRNGWFENVAVHMAVAFWYYRHDYPVLARDVASEIVAPDWRAGALLWLDQAAYRAAKKGEPRIAAPTDPDEPASVSIGDVRPA